MPSCLADREEMLRLFRGDFKGSKAFLQRAKAQPIEATISSNNTAAIGRSVRRAFTAGGLCTVRWLALLVDMRSRAMLYTPGHSTTSCITPYNEQHESV